MASTNSTTHYELSQYIGTDKPTYLVDYNQDMSKIDAGIYGAKSKADNNETSIGTLSNLQTTEKSNLVGAVNEVNTNSSNNATHIGTLSNLTTTEKSNLVGAINEVKSEADENKTNTGLLVNLTTTDKSNIVGAINEVKSEADGNKTDIASIVDFLNINTFDSYTEANMSTDNGTLSGSNITIATNSDKSLAKIYGTINLTPLTAGRVIVSLPNTGLAPTSDININNAGIFVNSTNYVIGLNMTIKTTGTIEFEIWTTFTTANQRATFIPCLYFIKDFGDTPNQNA